MARSLYDQVQEAALACEISYWLFEDDAGELWLAEWDDETKQFRAWPAINWVPDSKAYGCPGEVHP